MCSPHLPTWAGGRTPQIALGRSRRRSVVGEQSLSAGSGGRNAGVLMRTVSNSSHQHLDYDSARLVRKESEDDARARHGSPWALVVKRELRAGDAGVIQAKFNTISAPH